MPIHPNARRCIYYRLNGQRCGSPALKDRARCFYHEEIIQRRNRRKVPLLKTPAEHQQAVMEVIAGLVERRLDRGDATAVLYALQLAQNNLRISSFERTAREMQPDAASLVTQLLNEVDLAGELEDEADILKREADWVDSQHQAKLAKEFQLAQRNKTDKDEK